MPLKPGAGSDGVGLAERIEQAGYAVPALARDAEAKLDDWRTRARRFARANPGTVVLGAVAVGFIVARIARHA